MTYEEMLGNVASQYNTTPEALEDLMNRVSYHETGPYQRYQSDAVQMLEGGKQGVGQGLFQFEQRMIKKNNGQPVLNADGSPIYVQAGGLTARNRLANYYDSQGLETPDWLSQPGMDDPSKGFNAGALTGNQQRMLFLGNIAMGKDRTFEGMEDIPSWWSQHHHIGGGRTDEFERSMDAYSAPGKRLEDDLTIDEIVTETVNPKYQSAFELPDF